MKPMDKKSTSLVVEMTTTPATDFIVLTQKHWNGVVLPFLEPSQLQGENTETLKYVKHETMT